MAASCKSRGSLQQVSELLLVAVDCKASMADRPMRRGTMLLLLLALVPNALVDGMVIQRVFGANNSELAHASSGGGTHMYLAGTGMCAIRPRRARARLHASPHAISRSSRV